MIPNDAFHFLHCFVMTASLSEEKALCTSPLNVRVPKTCLTPVEIVALHKLCKGKAVISYTQPISKHGLLKKVLSPLHMHQHRTEKRGEHNRVKTLSQRAFRYIALIRRDSSGLKSPSNSCNRHTITFCT